MGRRANARNVQTLGRAYNLVPMALLLPDKYVTGRSTVRTVEAEGRAQEFIKAGSTKPDKKARRYAVAAADYIHATKGYGARAKTISLTMLAARRNVNYKLLLQLLNRLGVYDGE